MPFDSISVYREIRAKLEELPYKVYGTQVPDDEDLPKTGAFINPYIVVNRRMPSPLLSDRSMEGVRRDSQRMPFTVQIVSVNDDISAEIADDVVDKLLGFIPTNGSQVSAIGGDNWTQAGSTVAPTKYIYAVGFSTIVNLSGADT